jgi:anti-anti-sigma factor
MAPTEIDHDLGSGFSVRRQGRHTIATISGDIDIASAPGLRERLIDLLRPHPSQIVIDLSGASFCDASGLAVLVGASRRAALLGGVLRLAAPAPLLAELLRLTGLDLRFEIFATVPEAIHAPVRSGARDAGLPDVCARRAARYPAGEFEVASTAAVMADGDGWREARF